MDAIRLATGWTVKFRVEHLIIAREGRKALAVAEVTDASNQTEDAGIFELEGLNSQWRTLFSVGGGGGSADCADELAVLSRMTSKAQEYADPQDLLPAHFWQIAKENKSNDECLGTVSVDYSNSR